MVVQRSKLCGGQWSRAEGPWGMAGGKEIELSSYMTPKGNHP